MGLMDKRLARGRRLFEYHCYEGEDSSDAELWHHTHQPVNVLARVQDAGIIGGGAIRMYRVRFADGYEHDVFDDELVASADEYQRPDYVP